MSGATTTFIWNRDYGDHAQVEPFYAEYLAARQAMEARGAYPYDDSFAGLIPGLAGPDEGTAIYLLQTLHRLKEVQGRIEAFLADGGERIEALDETIWCERVACYGFYVGGTGWREHHDVRLVPRGGKPYMVMAKGARTRGTVLESIDNVLVIRVTDRKR